MTYAENIIKAIREIRSRKGASRPAIKNWLEANTDNVNPHAVRQGLKKLIDTNMIAPHESHAASFVLLEAAKTRKRAAPKKKSVAKKVKGSKKKAAPKRKPATKKKPAAKKSRPNYYKTIAGVKYDKGMLSAADTAIEGAGDGRISTQDAKALFAEAADGNKYTDIEKRTMAYIRDNYNFTPAGSKALHAIIKKWGVKKATETKKKKKSKKAAAAKKGKATKKKNASSKKKPAKKKATKKKK